MKLWGVNRLLNIQNLPINKHSLDNSLDIDDILLENTITNAIKLHLKYYIMDSFTSIPYIFINPPNSTKLLIFI